MTVCDEWILTIVEMNITQIREGEGAHIRDLTFIDIELLRPNGALQHLLLFMF